MTRPSNRSLALLLVAAGLFAYLSMVGKIVAFGF
jgi:hypothetical protein